MRPWATQTAPDITATPVGVAASVVAAVARSSRRVDPRERLVVEVSRPDRAGPGGDRPRPGSDGISSRRPGSSFGSITATEFGGAMQRLRPVAQREQPRPPSRQRAQRGGQPSIRVVAAAGRPGGAASRRNRSVEGRVLVEHRPLELPQRRPWLDPEVLDVGIARPSVRGQRVRLPARPVQREHLLGSKPLPVRMGGDERSPARRRAPHVGPARGRRRSVLRALDRRCSSSSAAAATANGSASRSSSASPRQSASAARRAAAASPGLGRHAPAPRSTASSSQVESPSVDARARSPEAACAGVSRPGRAPSAAGRRTPAVPSGPSRAARRPRARRSAGSSG